MDVLAELESMASNISVASECDVSDADVARWQRLFGFTKIEAIRRIEDHRNDYTRARIPEELWITIRLTKEAEGFDRETYEYSLTHQRCSPRATHLFHYHHQDTSGTYILRLDGPLDTAQKVKTAAGLAELPSIAAGVGESGACTSFCELDSRAKAKILAWISEHHTDFHPTIVRLAKAKKDLSAHSLAPTLSAEATLPQNRLPNNDTDTTFLPTQDQYPVWYFFYGTLGDSHVLTRHLGINEPELITAHVENGQLRTWGGKYKALVDTCKPVEVVHGKAFLVRDREQEDALRFYETDKYEVVRCRIVTADGVLPGLTFRFCGALQELE
ncbi:oxidoreductase domain containing protein [Cladophialophora carrionii]|uniref:Putative gamma-glutamylcyclotransferase n=1 Tax=Cladophialophora carrionii TaxID=86049 RepID=A0A1C1CWU9_9EURO|nr:oxidoreductase domain containing protein [Cladophialophora carrionii]